MFVIPKASQSWVDVDPQSDFPIQNLPFGRALVEDAWESVVVRIGDFALDLRVLVEAKVLNFPECMHLHGLFDCDRTVLSKLRKSVYDLLRSDNPTLRDHATVRDRALRPVSDLEMMVPVEIPAFTDFYSGIHHASNVGRMFRPDMPPLLPNYRHVPVAYNGRASSVIASDVPIRRPWGQTRPDPHAPPIFGPTRELDFELELGFFLGEGNEMGCPIPIEDAEDHIMGVVLLNDWSARDVQRWEYQPLGPFLAKSFATSISPWVVTLDALEPFRVTGDGQDPAPLEYLHAGWPSHYDLRLEVAIQSAQMSAPQTITSSNARYLYWSFVQQLAHLTSNGANSEPGDLIGTGTISGPTAEEAGSLLELSWRGERPIVLEETGESRTFLEDGDTVILRGYGLTDGLRIGFGEVRTTVLPAER